jgi:hypothetical protein
MKSAIMIPRMYASSLSKLIMYVRVRPEIVSAQNTKGILKSHPIVFDLSETEKLLLQLVLAILWTSELLIFTINVRIGICGTAKKVARNTNESRNPTKIV